MFPLRDSVPSSRPPVVNIALIGASALVFLYQLMLGSGLEMFVRAWGFVPARLFHPDLFEVGLPYNLGTMVVSMFMHGGWFHLIGNMWFLWVPMS